MHKVLPDGIRWGGLTPEDDGSQLLIDFPGFRNDPIAGYDRDEFVEMNLVHHGDDPKDDRNLPLAPRQARSPSGQQDRHAPGPQGPRLGRASPGP